MTRFSEALSKEIPGHLERAREATNQLLKQKKHLTKDITSEELAKQLDTYQEITHHLSAAHIRADAAFSTDQENEEKSKQLKQVIDQATQISQETIYFTLTLKDFGETLKEHEQALPQYQTYLRQVREQAKHALKEEQEQLISTKDKYGSNAINKIYDMITGAYTYKIELNGEEHHLTRAELATHMQSTNRETRKKARDSFYEQYGPDKHVLNEMYTALTGDYLEEATMRGYEQPINIRHQQNDITSDVYESLKEATKKHLSLFREYVDLKRRILGYEEMHGYDLRANIKGLPEGLSYEQAVKQVLNIFADYAPWLEEHAKTTLRGERVDAHPRKNKRSGACCYEATPGDEPLLILNHQEDYESLKTLAHETGHAVHNQLAHKHNALTYQPPIVLAETASNTAEYLVFKHYLAQADKQQRQALLCDFLDDALASIPRQILYTEYEEWACAHPDATFSERCEQWKNLQEEQFPALKREEGADYGWVSIPHIYQLPFYCYGYSFGLLLSLSLVEQASPEEIKTFLEAGGSEQPEKLLAKSGYDITNEDFWSEGFSKLQALVDELAETLEEKVYEDNQIVS